MIRCKCGRYTNYGVTCTSCRMSFSLIKEDTKTKSEEEKKKKKKRKKKT